MHFCQVLHPTFGRWRCVRNRRGRVRGRGGRWPFFSSALGLGRLRLCLLYTGTTDTGISRSQLPFHFLHHIQTLPDRIDQGTRSVQNSLTLGPTSAATGDLLLQREDLLVQETMVPFGFLQFGVQMVTPFRRACFRVPRGASALLEINNIASTSVVKPLARWTTSMHGVNLPHQTDSDQT